MISGHLVASLVAKDPDADDNGRISYQLVRGESRDTIPFHLEPTRGTLIVNEQLLMSDKSDPEWRQYNLAVVAVDHGNPSKSSEPVPLTIIVNKSAPLNSDVKLSLHNLSKTHNPSLTVAVCISVGCLLLLFVLVIIIALKRKRRNKYTAAASATANAKATTRLTTSVSPSGASVGNRQQQLPTTGWRGHSQNGACQEQPSSSPSRQVQGQGQGHCQSAASDVDSSCLVSSEPTDIDFETCEYRLLQVLTHSNFAKLYRLLLKFATCHVSFLLLFYCYMACESQAHLGFWRAP